MLFDLDESLKLIDPWDFSIRIHGEDFPTMPLSNAQLALFSNMKGMSRDQVNAAMLGMFGEKKPSIASLDDEYLNGLVAALLGYFRERTSKNSLRIAAQVGTVMREQNRSGTPSPR